MHIYREMGRDERIEPPITAPYVRVDGSTIPMQTEAALGMRSRQTHEILWCRRGAQLNVHVPLVVG